MKEDVSYEELSFFNLERLDPSLSEIKCFISSEVLKRLRELEKEANDFEKSLVKNNHRNRWNNRSDAYGHWDCIFPDDDDLQKGGEYYAL